MTEEPTVARSNSALLIPGAILLGALIIGVSLIIGLSRGTAGGTSGGAPQAVNIKDVATAGEPYIGNANAPIVMAFWSDFQCPYCKAYEVGGVPQLNEGQNGIPAPFPALVKKYVDAGKLKVVFKDFAFLGNDSIAAAEYGRAVWDLYPEKYAVWREEMYKAQDEEGDKGFGNAETIQALIRNIPGMDASKVAAQVAAKKSQYDKAIAADRAEGSKYGINGTPGFITGTTLIPGFYALNAFESAIDQQLK